MVDENAGLSIKIDTESESVESSSISEEDADEAAVVHNADNRPDI